MNRTFKFFLASAVSAMLFASSAFSAPFSLNSVPSQALASITVGDKTEIITKSELDSKIQDYRTLGMTSTEDEILDVLINDKVFLMSAERDGVSVSDGEVNDRLKQARSQVEMQLNRPLTDAEFDEYVLSSTANIASVDEYKEELKKVLLVDKYVRTKKAADLDKVAVVADSEVNSFYRRNKTQFVNPEYVRISHIFVRKTDDPVANGKGLEKLRSVLSDIKSGIITFERAVGQYSEDSDSVSRGGDIGSVTTSATNILGEHFVDVSFTLDPGDIAPEVVESTQGYHIIKATAHADAKFLGIDDHVTPDSNMTVREYIRNYLQQQKAQDDYAAAVNSFVDDLKKSARITYVNKRGE